MRIPIGKYLFKIDPIRAVLYALCAVVVLVVWWLTSLPKTVITKVAECSGAECDKNVASEEPSEEPTETEKAAPPEQDMDIYGPGKVGEIAVSPAPESNRLTEDLDNTEPERSQMSADLWSATDPTGPYTTEPQDRDSMMPVSHDGMAYR